MFHTQIDISPEIYNNWLFSVDQNFQYDHLNIIDICEKPEQRT